MKKILLMLCAFMAMGFTTQVLACVGANEVCSTNQALACCGEGLYGCSCSSSTEGGKTTCTNCGSQ